jgi:hypothetical protein
MTYYRTGRTPPRATTGFFSRKTLGGFGALGDVCDPTDPAYDATACTAAGGTPGIANSESSSGTSTTTTPGGVSTTSNDVTTGAPVLPYYDVNGVCYATTTDGGVTLGLFKEFQRQLNRIASVIQAPALAVDGAIGPMTLTLIGTINGAIKTANQLTALGLSSLVPDTNAAAIVAGTAIPGVQNIANTLGAPSSVSSPSSTPQVYNPATGTLQTQAATADIGDIWNNLSSNQQMIAVAGLVLVGGFVLAGSSSSSKKTGSAPAKKSSRRRTSRRRSSRRSSRRRS